jgi:hypothetical protein
MTSENPFLEIGAPPDGEDAEAQLTYLKRVVAAFESTSNPRIKPLRRKLEEALADLADGAGRGADAESLATQFAGQVDALRAQTYELLLVVINQVRATLRVKLKQGVSPGERVDTERLQKALAFFSQGLRKTLRAQKSGDPDGQREAREMLSDASRALEETGVQLTQL